MQTQAGHLTKTSSCENVQNSVLKARFYHPESFPRERERERERKLTRCVLPIRAGSHAFLGQIQCETSQIGKKTSLNDHADGGEFLKAIAKQAHHSTESTSDAVLETFCAQNGKYRIVFPQ